MPRNPVASANAMMARRELHQAIATLDDPALLATDRLYKAKMECANALERILDVEWALKRHDSRRADQEDTDEHHRG